MAFSARLRAERRPYNRAQSEVITSVTSLTRSSSSSLSSMTKTRAPRPARADSKYSNPKPAEPLPMLNHNGLHGMVGDEAAEPPAGFRSGRTRFP